MQDGDNWCFYSSYMRLTGWWNIGSNQAKKTYFFTQEGIMVAGKWLPLNGKWYYFNADGSLARNTTIDGYEVDEKGVRKRK